MSTEQNKMTDATTPRNMTCYVFYGENDDVSKIFEVLKDFRVRYGLKFSHHSGYVYFSISSEHLDELAKVRPFKVSKFHSRSEYKCSEEVANEIQKQRDSFVRTRWFEEEGKLVFTSRIKSNAHYRLVRRLFKEANQEFDNNNYTNIIRKKDGTEHEVKHVDEDEEQKVVKVAEEKPNVEGFVKVERKQRAKKLEEEPVGKTRTPRAAKETKTKYETKDKIEKEAEEAPKVRGKRVTKKTA